MEIGVPGVRLAGMARPTSGETLSKPFYRSCCGRVSLRDPSAVRRRLRRRRRYSRFASLTMPRSITQIRSARPHFFSISATLSSTVPHIRTVARKHFIGQRQPPGGNHQPNANLLAVRAVVAMVPALGLGLRTFLIQLG
jgi:hypothetical protein